MVSHSQSGLNCKWHWEKMSCKLPADLLSLKGCEFTKSLQQWQTDGPSFSRKANCSSSFIWNMQANYTQKTKCCTRQSVPIESNTSTLNSACAFLLSVSLWDSVKGVVVMGAVVPERFGCSDPLSFGQAQNRNMPLAWNSKIGGVGKFAQWNKRTHLHTNCLNVHPLCHFATCLSTFDHVCMILHAFLMGLTHPCLHVFLRQFNHAQETKEETKGMRYYKMESNKHGCSWVFYHVLSRHQSLKIPLCQALGELRDLVPQSPPTVHLRTPWIQASRPVKSRSSENGNFGQWFSRTSQIHASMWKKTSRACDILWPTFCITVLAAKTIKLVAEKNWH